MDINGNMLRIKTYGNRNLMSGLPQLEKVWTEMGHEIVNDNPDILYHANGFFSDLLEDSKKYPKAIKIGCLLDANPENKSWGNCLGGSSIESGEQKVRNQLKQLDIKVTISKTAQDQIIKRTNIICDVVGYPIKNITYLKYPFRGVRMLVVGRIYSKNKRLQLIKETAEAYCGDAEQILFVGPEKPPFGLYAGQIDESLLNICYNSSIFLLGLSSVEGLFLPMLESCCSRTVPILTLDNKCVHEFGLEYLAEEPDPIKLARKMKEIEKNFDKYQKRIEKAGQEFRDRFSPQTVAKNILELYNNYVKENPNYEKKS